MALSHVFSNQIADGTNTQLVRPSDWNSAHNFFQTISGNTAGQSTFSGTNMVLQGGDNVTLSANTAAGAATLIISAAAGAGGGAALQGSGTYTQNTGTIQFANSNGVTFGLSNNGVMTASVVPGGGSPFSAGISGGNTSGNTGTVSNQIVLAGGNNITVSGSTNAGGMSVTISGANAGGAQTGISGLSAGTTQMTSGTASFADANNVSFGVNGNTITASVVPQSTQPVAISGSNASAAFSTASFGNSNGLSFYMTNGSMVGSYTVPTQSVQPVAYSAANGSANFSTLTFANSNGVSFSTGTQGLYATVATDYAASNHSHDFATTTTNGSQVVVATENSSGVTIAVPPFITTFTPQSAMGFSGSNGSFTASTLSFGASNGLTFYTTNGSIVGSYTDAGGTGGGDGVNIVMAGSTGTTGTVWSNNTGTVYLNGSNGVIVSQNNSNQIVLDGSNFATAVHLEGNTSGASSIQIQGQAMHWCGGNNITLSANGSSVTISADRKYGNLVPVGNFPASISSFPLDQGIGAATNRAYFFPFSIDQNWSGDHVMIPMSNSWVTSTNTGTQQISLYWGIYTNNANTLSTLYSNSMGFTATNNNTSGTVNYPTSSGTAGYGYGTASTQGTAALQSKFGTAGIRVVDLYFTNTISLSSGLYWFGINKREATNANAAGISLGVVGNVVLPWARRWPFGVDVTTPISSTWIAPFIGLGAYTLTTATNYGGTNIPATAALSAIPAGPTMYTNILMTFDNGTW